MLFLPLYLIFGVVWRFSVLAGHPINESKNRKWRLGFLVAFLVFSFIGIVVGIAGMGSARHFREVHGVSIYLLLQKDSADNGLGLRPVESLVPISYCRCLNRPFTYHYPASTTCVVRRHQRPDQSRQITAAPLLDQWYPHPSYPPIWTTGLRPGIFAPPLDLIVSR